MSKINFWVEGKADQKFLADLIEFAFNLPMKKVGNRFESDRCRIYETGGKDVFNSSEKWKRIKPLFEVDESVKNVVIFDADDSPGDHERKLKTEAAALSIEFDLFLFPGNQKPGNLETILEKLLKPENEALFLECWKGYEDCLSAKTNQFSKTGQFFTPDMKAMIYSHLMAFTGDSKLATDSTRNYLDTRFWNLEADQLNPLKTFLKTQLALAAD